MAALCAFVVHQLLALAEALVLHSLVLAECNHMMEALGLAVAEELAEYNRSLVAPYSHSLEELAEQELVQAGCIRILVGYSRMLGPV